MQFTGKFHLNLGTKKLWWRTRLQIFKIRHTFSSGKEKYLKAIIGIIYFLPNAHKNVKICFEKRILHGVLITQATREFPCILTPRPSGAPTTAFSEPACSTTGVRLCHYPWCCFCKHTECKLLVHGSLDMHLKEKQTLCAKIWITISSLYEGQRWSYEGEARDGTENLGDGQKGKEYFTQTEHSYRQ